MKIPGNLTMRLFVFILFAAVFLAVAVCPGGAEFDFYATDMISREGHRKISMDFKDASLKTILKIFSEQAGLNFISSQNVQDRPVTLYLAQVPLQEALNKIMSANNLTYDLEPGSNVFIVKEWGRPLVDTQVKIYRLRYARLKASRLQSAISEGGSGDSTSAGGGAGGAGGGGGESGSGDGGNIEDSVTAVLTANGKLVSDVRTNSLIVTDIPSQFSVIDKLVALLDTPTPQVMIEVEMLDVSKRTLDQMGMDLSGQFLEFSGSSGSTRFPGFLAKGTDPGPGSFSYGTLSSAVFTAMLELLTTDSRTKFLARPRIMTLSNESAEIKITTDEAIGLTTSTTSGEGTAQTQQEAERAETGVSLKVTPQVDSDTGIVTMFVQPSVKEAKTGASFPTSSGSITFKDPEQRTSTSTLMVKSGETIVVGGLIRSKEETTIKKTPFLGDIPLIGALFRHKTSTKEDRELIVFITPHVIGYKDAISIAMGESGISAPMSVYREQSSPVARRQVVDTMLERWEN